MTAAADLDPAMVWASKPTPPEPTPWGRFLGHSVGCAGCRAGQRCAVGNGLHHAVREALTAAAP